MDPPLSRSPRIETVDLTEHPLPLPAEPHHHKPLKEYLHPARFVYVFLSVSRPTQMLEDRLEWLAFAQDKSEPQGCMIWKVCAKRRTS
jgi:hypothetical protein